MGRQNFVQRQSLSKSKLNLIEREIPPTRMTVRLATGASVTVMKHVVRITYTLKEVSYNYKIVVLELDEKFDVILVLPWLRGTRQKSAGIDEQSICPPLVHHMAIWWTSCVYICGCTISECDRLTWGLVVITTARDHNVTKYQNLEQDSGEWIETQDAPVAHDWQYDDPRSIGESNVEDLAGVA